MPVLTFSKPSATSAEGPMFAIAALRVIERLNEHMSTGSRPFAVTNGSGISGAYVLQLPGGIGQSIEMNDAEPEQLEATVALLLLGKLYFPDLTIELRGGGIAEVQLLARAEDLLAPEFRVRHRIADAAFSSLWVVHAVDTDVERANSIASVASKVGIVLTTMLCLPLRRSHTSKPSTPLIITTTTTTTTMLEELIFPTDEMTVATPPTPSPAVNEPPSSLDAEPTSPTSRFSDKAAEVAKINTLATSAKPSALGAKTVDGSVLERISKALALAEHRGSGEAEAHQALRAAKVLMEKHNVSQADLLSRESAEDRSLRGGLSSVDILPTGTGRTEAIVSNWHATLAFAMVAFFDVKHYFVKHHGSNPRVEWSFYGIAENTAAAAVAFETCHNLIINWSHDPSKDLHGRTGFNSYRVGAADGLYALSRASLKAEEKLARAAEAAAREMSDTASDGDEIDAEYEEVGDSSDAVLMAKIDEAAATVSASWKTTGQLSLFRANANEIADSYLTSVNVILKRGVKRSVSNRDGDAYRRGEADGRTIDVLKRKKIRVKFPDAREGSV